MNNSKQIHFEWIGAVPSNWELRKIKYIFMERKEMNNPIKSKNLISLTMDKGVIPHSEKEGGGNKPKEDLSKYKLVYPGDVVLNSMNVIAGAVGLSKYFGVLSPVYYMLKLFDNNANKEYFNYLFRTEIFQKSLYGLGNGILIKENEETGKLNTIRMRISMDKLGNQFIPVPPNQEQKLISQYLDLKTQKIDTLIEKIEKKIELLKEQKNALINQFITKGLDPTVEMKDSGVEWIGEIPKHWELSKLKFVSRIFGRIGYRGYTVEDIVEEGNGCITLGPGNIINNSLNLESKTFLSWEKYYESPEIQIFNGDVIFVKTGSTIGKSCYVKKTKYQMTINPQIVVLKDLKINAEYLFYLSISPFFQNFFKTESAGGSTPTISQEKIKNFKIIVPPKEEQLKLIEVINKYVEKNLSLETKFREKIKLLQEYRQSLISSVVTGKMRITEDML